MTDFARDFGDIEGGVGTALRSQVSIEDDPGGYLGSEKLPSILLVSEPPKVIRDLYGGLDGLAGCHGMRVTRVTWAVTACKCDSNLLQESCSTESLGKGRW